MPVADELWVRGWAGHVPRREERSRKNVDMTVVSITPAAQNGGIVRIILRFGPEQSLNAKPAGDDLLAQLDAFMAGGVEDMLSQLTAFYESQALKSQIAS